MSKTPPLAALCLLLLASAQQPGLAASAADAAAPMPMTRIVQLAETFLAGEAKRLAGAMAASGQVTVRVLPPDAKQSLPACTALHAFLPPGTRAKGRTTVGVRCAAPSPWTVFLPARVSIPGQYLVARHPLRSGQNLGEGDVELRAGDLAELPESTLTTPAQVVGQSTRQALTAGQPLLSSMLRAAPVIRQGDSVRIIGNGQGFTIVSEGKALNTAAPGEVVRLRMDNGEVVSATAQPDGKAHLPF